jgi:NAD-dependent deacetylase
MDIFTELFVKAGNILANSRSAIAFTGAGISTPSGIPDFRSPGTGLWSKDNPFEVASIYTFRHDPQRFYNWIRPLARKAETAIPNKAHFGLVEMEERGILKAIITQNIDGLHQKAGSKNVFELHGNARTASCPKCGQLFDEKDFKDTFLRDRDIPHCQKCASILKPNVVLFGEMLPDSTWQISRAASHNADVVLVVGSSLEVSPANSLPQSAISNGAKLIIVNNQETHLNHWASVVLSIDVEIGISGILKNLG